MILVSRGAESGVTAYKIGCYIRVSTVEPPDFEEGGEVGAVTATLRRDP